MADFQKKNEREAGKNTAWLRLVQKQVNSLRYGVIQIVVHDSQVTQIDKTECVRLGKPRAEII